MYNSRHMWFPLIKLFYIKLYILQSQYQQYVNYFLIDFNVSYQEPTSLPNTYQLKVIHAYFEWFVPGNYHYLFMPNN